MLCNKVVPRTKFMASFERIEVEDKNKPINYALKPMTILVGMNIKKELHSFLPKKKKKPGRKFNKMERQTRQYRGEEIERGCKLQKQMEKQQGKKKINSRFFVQ